MVIGFSLQTWGLIITGIVICSIGEFMVAPGYMAFVSKLAPKENVSAYIGCNFISYMIGLLGGTFVFSLIVSYVGVDLMMPYLFYGILISFALILLFLFIIYYRTWGQDVLKRAKKIKELEEGEDKDLGIPSDYKEPVMFRIFDSNITAIVPLILVPIVLIGSFSFGTFEYIGPVEDGEIEAINWTRDYDLLSAGLSPKTGSSNENSESVEAIVIEQDNLKSITFTLTWTDEPDNTPIYTNNPDEFSIEAVAPNGTPASGGPSENIQGGEGKVSATLQYYPDKASSYFFSLIRVAFPVLFLR